MGDEQSAEELVRAMLAGPDLIGAVDVAHTALVVVDMANDVAHPDGALRSAPGVDTSLYEACVEPLLRLVDGVRALGMTWIAVESAYDGEYVPAPMAAKLEAMGLLGVASPKGAWGSTILAELDARSPDYRVLKSHFSPFSSRAVTWRPHAAADLDRYLLAPRSADGDRAGEGRPTLVELFDEARCVDPGDALSHLAGGGVTSLDALLRGLGVDTLVVAGGATHVCQDATVSAASERSLRIIEPIDACGSEDPDSHWTYLYNHAQFRTVPCTVDALLSSLVPGR